MESIIEQLAGPAPYLIFFLLFLATGFGLPLPEDIPLLVAGYMCSASIYDHPQIEIMIPVCLVAIVGSDLVLYLAGRKFGHKLLRKRFVGRILSRKRLLKAELEIVRHGGKFVFVARFLPGLRAPAFFASGVFKVPVARFLLYDGLAAMISVPTILMLGAIFATELDHARQQIVKGQTWTVGIAIALVLVFIAGKVFVLRRGAAIDEEDLERQLAEAKIASGRSPDLVTPSRTEFGRLRRGARALRKHPKPSSDEA